MLPFIDLSGKTFEETVYESIKNIGRYSDDWKGSGIHDPGIMLIELFAWLNTERRKEINKVTVKNLCKLLTLSGMDIKPAIPAVCNAVLTAENDTMLPKCTKFCYDDIVFETRKKQQIFSNKIIWHNGGSIFDSSNNNHAFIIHMEKPLVSNVDINIIVEIDDKLTALRNPINNERTFIPLAVIKWEFYGNVSGKTGWFPIEIIKDTTYNLLFSGMLTIRIDGAHTPLNSAYAVRGTIFKSQYEIKPCVKNVHLNGISLVQTDTKCISICFNAHTVRQNAMYVDNFLAYYGKYDLYVQEEKTLTSAAKRGLEFILVSDGESPRLLISPYRDFLSSIGHINDEETVLKLVLYDDDFYTKKIAGIGNGFSEQTIKPPVSGTRQDNLELTLIDKNEVCQIFTREENLDDKSADDTCFIFNEFDSIIKFGNNEHGAAPFAKSAIVYTALETTYGEKGNIKENLLKIKDSAAPFHGVSVVSHSAAKNGKHAESFEQLAARIPMQTNKISSAVTKEDYESIAKNTQGLMIKDAVALPLYEPINMSKAENTVTVVVEPYTSGETRLKRRYLKNVKVALNEKRLAGTRVFVIYPTYVEIEVFCELAVKDRSDSLKQNVNAALEKAVKEAPLGQVVSLSALRKSIERVHGVLYTKYIHMEFLGDAKKNIFGDIVLLPHAKACLKYCDIIMT